MKGVFFSIIMPVYNDEKNIGKAIESILNQSYKNWELIIVDDCSTDGSYEIAKRFASKNQKIRLYKMNKNVGAASCMNFGTAKAKYYWISIVDSDAVMPKDWLDIAKENINNGVGVLGGNCIYVFNKKKYFQNIFFYLEKEFISEKKIIYNKNYLKEPRISGTNFFYNKNTFQKVKGFDINLRAAYDRLFISQAVEKEFEVVYIPSLLVYHPLPRDLLAYFKWKINSSRWRLLAIKKSKLIAKPYKKFPYLLLGILLFSLLSLFNGLLNTLFIISFLILLFLLLSSFKLLIKNKIPLKYIFGYVILDFFTRSIGAITYLFNLKPKQLDWKDRTKNANNKNDPKK